MRTKEVQYWQGQEERWFRMWDECQKAVDETDYAIKEIAGIAKAHIKDEGALKQIKEILDRVFGVEQ